MKSAGIIANLDKEQSIDFAAEIVCWLKCQGITPFVSKDLGARASNDCMALEEALLCAKSDFIIVLGGDGTILRASRCAASYNRPILGINLGTIGYLTDVEKVQGIAAIKKIVNGDFITEKRMMIEAEIFPRTFGEASEKLIALNDICVLRGSVAKVITFKLNINEGYMDTFRADGIIVSTPTGSTAYNLSAGGPILKPDIELIAITPVCAHTMLSRPLVISAKDSVTLEIGDCHGGDPLLSLDGQKYIPLERGNIVKIWKSEVYTNLIKTENRNFFDILRMKLHR